ncbi:hypothetical protein ACHAWF_008832 [Thalassiosira exigua]
MVASEVIAKSVILATSWAPLLSGLLDQCFNADDPTCRGGAAAFRAMLRHHRGDDPAVHLQLLDKNNAFVHMHPLGLSINRVVLNGLMGLDVFASSPSILLQNKLDYDVSSQDISYLQTHDMPLLLTNVNVSPGNSWHPFTKAVHFDEDTGLAVLSVSKSKEELNAPQIDSTIGTLRYVRKINEENGCITPSDSAYDNMFLQSNATGDGNSDAAQKTCWLPVVYHSDDSDQFIDFLQGMLTLPTHHRPAMIIDIGGNFEEYETPTLVEKIWVASHRWDSRTYFHHKLNILYGGPDGPALQSAPEFKSVPLSPLPDDLKDDIYKSEILALRKEADIALKNNPVVGHSTFMPVTRDSSSDYRPCKSGECPIGNLFTDAARWYTGADVAFITSGGVRGPGWPAGEVHVSDVWAALPFPNMLCTGYMNGVHLFQLLNYSMAVATFEGVDTDDGGKLLQISGMKVRYNTELTSSRIISIDILDRESNEYHPIDRLKTYKFATDSYVCDAYALFPSLLDSTALTVEGEQPEVASFLDQSTSSELVYNSSTQGRLVNDTSVTEALNLIQTEDTCAPGEYWKSDIETCLLCPIDFDVSFSRQKIELEVVSHRDAQSVTVALKNHEQFGVAVIPKKLPHWLKFSSIDFGYTGTESPSSLGPGESLRLSMVVDPSDLEEGTAYLTIGFGVLDGGDYLGCVGQDATFDLTMRVLPTEQKNQLGSIRAVGFTLFGIIAFTSISFAAFVFCHHQQQIVRALQPIFLVTICFGVLVLGTAIVPLSLDDETITSQKGCDIKCMSLPWLIIMGFSISISALFAKLWRINRLFNADNSFRRVQVRAKDVAVPMFILLAINVAILLAWSLVDPLRWHRFEMDGASWNTYGICVGSSQSHANAFFVVVGIVNLCALGFTLIQAWKARNISDEFSETKIVGVAIYSWLQLLIVGVPCLFLIDRDNTKPRYFLLVALIFAVCMSMLLIIFVPLLWQIRRAKIQRKIQVCQSISSQNSSAVRISGLNINPARLSEMRKENQASPRSSDETKEPLEVDSAV